MSYCSILFLVDLSSFRYDHLCEVLTKILEERKTDAVDMLEDLSRETKKFKFQQNADTIIQMTEPSPEIALATIEKKLFTV